MFRKLAFAAVLTAATAFPAMAENWSMNLSSCSPSDKTARQERYKTTVGQVSFRGTATGTLVFRCPVAAADLTSVSAQLVLYAADGDGDKSRVKIEATLISQTVTTGAASEQTLATVSTAPANDPGVLVHVSDAFDHLFEFDSKQYYVEVKVFREKSGSTAVAFGVAVRLAQI